ncbi:MAG: GNAT family N-acetyltransferase [Chloroflexi bacterium UTCFX4]|nr:MAG: GNAT family N-acetyltransferase [Chloroflexi bacterium UTCFX4]
MSRLTVTVSLPTLDTARLILRPFELRDAPRVQALAGAREIAEMTSNIPYPYPDGAAEEWIGEHANEWRRGDAAIFAMVQRETNELIGAIGLTIHAPHRRAEMGYWLGVSFWNQGYTTEAARAVLRFAFETLKLHRVHAAHFARNPASGRVMQKSGMTYEGTLRQHFLHWDRLEDLVYYGILESEWQRTTNL